MIKLSPSILSADLGNLKEEILKLEKGGADYIHLDVMDGIFVPNITFGPPVIKHLRNITQIPFDVHLMIDKPERYIEDFVEAGADMLTVHVESTLHLHRTIDVIKSYGIKAGVALNPSTPLESIEYVLDYVDLILIMTVNPGFGGQEFIGSMEKKIKKMRRIIDEKNLNILLEADGGIKLDNAKEIINYGLDIIVVGSDIFRSKDVIERTKMFKSL
ncbi:ribulose-phosphate 3-epimerase [Tepidimicrobium xylanilyticum]|uniref:Ribulose-phosphate 3-epimerase n=1 Tax=Tepidimicrobium xylanilyticum TaxID=1123352 RepID=A0A1H2YSC6_9FIRM|nr:ribulose-phosphate 3-epimerase [Tepidimicrobium xylanilyticum]GMG97187.1 ribulose-phosphate 3-epimerase [Tepidimicrobium xylanilyticum]SDX07429.1 ribulose-5-phosphate 3-epimerase [Tepidimicrobium xylanilyticum]